MCFTVSIYASTHDIETDIGAVFTHPQAYMPFYNVTGFVHPYLPLIANDNPDDITLCTWGLIPAWCKLSAEAMKIRSMTLNARVETVFSKPSFRGAMKRNRALLPVNGFIEWHDEGGTKTPYYVTIRDGGFAYLATTFDDWLNRESGELIRSFTILTKPATGIMSRIHNTKQRMPVIVAADVRCRWLNTTHKVVRNELLDGMGQVSLKAYPVKRLVGSIRVNTTDATLLDPQGPTLSD